MTFKKKQEFLKSLNLSHCMTWSFVSDTVLQYLFVASIERAGLNHLRLSYIFQKEGGNIFQSKPSFDRIGRKLEKQDLAKGFKFKFFKPNLNIFCTIFALFSSFLFIFLASTSAYFFRTFVFSASIPAIFMGFHILASILHIFLGAPKSLLNIQCRFSSPHSQPMH